jgi:hypothetical protein
MRVFLCMLWNMLRHEYRPRLCALVASAAALITFPSTARADCTKDDECKGARICVRGTCVDPAPGAPLATAPLATAPLATAPTAIPTEWHVRDPGMRRAGIGLVIAGVAVNIVGAAFLGVWSQGVNSYTSICGDKNNAYGGPPPPPRPDNGCATGTLVVGALGTAIGGAMWITGIPLWVIGGSRAPGPAPAGDASVLDLGGARLMRGSRGLVLAF